MQKRSSFSCEEHIDIAMDDFILDNEIFPVLDKLYGINTKCQYCTRKATYILEIPNIDKDF
ncbi:CxxH/CxxC protein [Clostridium lundense]|uniref:CxxH/CxxC protein n=1 Tax=Clostridium lundense TaxID=319475 RepID=UPI000481166E|nr:CxxH/CxxC protein [Clostridium lundense]